MDCYLLIFPRPIGIDPTIYLNKPKIIPRIVEHEDEVGNSYTVEDPYSTPTLVKCRSIKQAINRIKSYNDTDFYLSKLRIKKHYKGNLY